MCYNLSKNTPENKLIERWNKKKLAVKDLFQPAVYINGFSHPKMHIIKSEGPEIIDVANWGLVPSFITNEIKAKDYAGHTLNAKAETVFSLPSYKNSIQPRRCLVPVTGFFEWRTVNKMKYPYFIHLKDEEVFTLGGIYDSWVNTDTGEITNTFSIITTPANPLMEVIHNEKKRMPLIFTKETENEWINPNLNVEEIKNLMKPLDEKHIAAHTIRKISPKTFTNTPELIEEFEYPELTLIDN